MAVEGRGRHAQALGDLDHGDLGIAQQSLGRGQILGFEGRGPTTSAASRSRIDAALELGQGREDMEDRLAADRSSVDGLGQRSQADLARPEFLNSLDQLLERAGEAIQFSHHQGVALAHVLERRLESRPLALRTRGFLSEHLLQPAIFKAPSCRVRSCSWVETWRNRGRQTAWAAPVRYR